MSRESDELRAITEAVFGALNSGDLDAFVAFVGDDVEFTSFVTEFEGTTFRGHAGVRAWWETVYRAFEEVKWEVLDVRASGDRGVTQTRWPAG